MIEEPPAPAEPVEEVQAESSESAPARGQWIWRWLVPLLIFSAFCTLYFSTHTRWYTFDSVAYATDMREYRERGDPAELVHPHHLLFNSLGYGFWTFLESMGVRATSLEATQILNSIVGAFLLAVFYRMLLSRGFRWRGPPKFIERWPTVEIAATLCLGLSFGFWAVSTDGRVNAPALLMLTLAIGFAWGAIDHLTRGQVVCCTIASVLAVALHQSHGLVIAFVTACILLALASQRRRFRRAAAYLVGTGMGIAGIYALMGIVVAGHTSMEKLTQWALIYSEDGRWWKLDFWNNFVDLNTRAYSQAFIAAPPTLTEGPMEHWQFNLLEFLRESVMPILTALIFVGLLFVVRGVVKDRKSPSWRMVLALSALAVPYTIFFTVWDPGYWVFWIPLTMATLALVALLCHQSHWLVRVPVTLVLLVWAGASGIANHAANFERRTDVAVNAELVALLTIGRDAKPGDMMLTSGIGSGAKFEVYAPYFAHLEVSVGHMEMKRAGGDFGKAKASIRHKIREAIKAGNRVYIAREYYVPQQWEAIGKRYVVPADARLAILEGYGGVEVPTGSSVRLFYLEPKPPRPVRKPPIKWVFSPIFGTRIITPPSK